MLSFAGFYYSVVYHFYYNNLSTCANCDIKLFIIVTLKQNIMKTDSDRIFNNQRSRMINDHLVARGIADSRVLEVMGKIPRELFVPVKYRSDSYGDHPLPIGYNQTISQPYIVALMTELCELKGDEKVLEIGCGSGYQTAILSALAGRVFSIERIRELAESAEKLLSEQGYSNVKVMHGDGFMGLLDEAPFNVIILTAAPGSIPDTLKSQLTENGRLVAPIGDNVQQLIRLRKSGGEFNIEYLSYVSFVPMLKGFN